MLVMHEMSQGKGGTLVKCARVGALTGFLMLRDTSAEAAQGGNTGYLPVKMLWV